VIDFRQENGPSQEGQASVALKSTLVRGGLSHTGNQPLCRNGSYGRGRGLNTIEMAADYTLCDLLFAMLRDSPQNYVKVSTEACQA